MKTRIDKKFTKLKQLGQKGFIAYVTAGDPDLAGARDIVLRLEDIGVDIVELGIPFSDPLADGKVNQESALRALAAGTTLEGVLDLIARIRRQSDIPILCYSYFNLMYTYGLKKTAKDATHVGLDGFLVLDLPVEEAAPVHAILTQQALNHIYLVTPTSPVARIRKIVEACSGFVYCVSRTGVTGMQKQIEGEAGDLVATTKKLTPLPVALGFGISSPAQARKAARLADAVVVGSAIVDRFHRAAATPKGRVAAAQWVKTLVDAVKR